jgi:hypothetical protein
LTEKNTRFKRGPPSKNQDPLKTMFGLESERLILNDVTEKKLWNKIQTVNFPTTSTKILSSFMKIPNLELFVRSKYNK